VALDVYKHWLGIPDGPRPPDHYQLLRLVEFEDDFDKINKFYKKLNTHVRKYATGQYMLQSQDLLNELAKAKLCLTDPERKREYDEGLGREFPEELDEFGRRGMENILHEQGHISREQIREVQNYAEARGLSIRDSVVQMKLVDPETAAQALAQDLGLPYLDLDDVYPDDSVLDKVPRLLVKRNSILPLFVDNETLLVACAIEPTPELEEELRLRFEMPMRAVLSTPLAVNQGISKYYAPGARDEAASEQAATSTAKKQVPRKQPRKRGSQLSSTQQAERRNLGVILMCWGTIGAYLFDQFVLKPWLFPSWTLWIPPMLTTLIVAPAVVLYVLKIYWK